ncbi:MAG: DUF2608 domain-containing protein [Holosporaceae bacterium]|nr:MAG: DUF2608 domain-containing protein [Holosporaceae bacterium]
MLKALIFCFSLLNITTHHAKEATSFPIATSAEEVSTIIQKNDVNENTWVIFDIYHTLAQPLHPASHAIHLRVHKKHLKKEIKTLTKPQIEYAMNSSVAHENGLTLTDAAFPQLIRDLQKKKACVWALTTSRANQFKQVKSIKHWTERVLKDLGISFEKSGPKINYIHLIHPDKYYDPAIVHKGIVFTNGEYDLTKGEALVLVLREVSEKPHIVYTVDDKEENLRSMADALKQYDPNIRFVGIIFRTSTTSAPNLSLKSFMAYWQEHIKAAQEACECTNKW